MTSLRQLEVIPNPENASPKDMEVAMEAAPNKRSYIRLGALRALMLGTSRVDVCKLYCRTDRMLRLWIVMFNTGGIDALISRPKPGRPRKVSLQRLGDLLVPVLKDPALAGERHWTGVKIHGWLKTQISEDLSYRSVIRSLHALDFHRRIPRPWPMPPEERAAEHEQKRAAFKQQLTAWAADPAVRLWFCDESGFEGDPRPRHRWVQPGSRPTVPYRGKHLRANVIGAVSPEDGALFTVVVSGVDTDVFQAFLDELAATHPARTGERQILVQDNASWHKSRGLHWHHFEPQFLPPYSPDFNPIERLWLRIKCDWFSDYIAKTGAELGDHLCAAFCAFMDDPVKVASNTAFRK